MRLQRRFARTAFSVSRWPPSLLERGKCSWVGIQSLDSSVTDSKVARASKLLGQKAFGHLACELRASLSTWPSGEWFVCGVDSVEALDARGHSPSPASMRYEAGVEAVASTASATVAPVSLRYWCTNAIAKLPSPTAEATRLTGPERTSPHAKMPGTLVSRR
jgi:hypothetical protein